ncbi:MAG: hypothetical protein WB564_06110 [Dehalococcoidia bacterium]
MSDGIVVDANVIPDFYRELCVNNGCVYRTVIWLSEKCGIVASDKVLIEWENVCSAQVFIEWLADQLKAGGVRRIQCKKIDRRIVKRMRVDCGFPCKDRDLEYIQCAHATASERYIVTEDIDFYDPRAKGGEASIKRWAREERCGQFCRFLLRRLGIKVGTISHCREDFGIP